MEEELVVYKVFRKSKYGGYDTPYWTPPYGPWRVGEMKTDIPVDEIVHAPKDEVFGYQPFILGGGFHSFATLEAAESETDWLNRRWGGGFFVGKCVIPAYSKFVYRGTYDEIDEGVASYVSEKLMLIETYESHVS